MNTLVPSLAILYLTTVTVTASVLPKQTWIDVCDYQDPTGSKCCAPGMEDHKYSVVPEPHDWTDHDQLCRVYGGQLVVLETRAEWACIEHWVENAYQPAYQRYAISMKKSNIGDYRWFYADGSNAFPDYFEWAAGHPTDDPCVSMEIGTGVDHEGQWIDGACLEESNLYAICEQSGSAPPTTTTPQPALCPDGWEEYEDSCYRAMEGKMNWEEAEAVCNLEEAHLVSIRDQAENDFVFERFHSTVGKHWLGGHATCPGCDDWTWTDGSQFSFTYWAGPEPNNAGGPEDCIEMGWYASSPDQWNDWRCTNANTVVCERSKV